MPRREEVSTETVIVAILGMLGTIAGSYLSNRKSSALIAYRLEQLEKKVEKHNSAVERTGILEEQMKVVNHRITDLENVVKE